MYQAFEQIRICQELVVFGFVQSTQRVELCFLMDMKAATEIGNWLMP
jgi:hypothetical protein